MLNQQTLRMPSAINMHPFKIFKKKSNNKLAWPHTWSKLRAQSSAGSACRQDNTQGYTWIYQRNLAMMAHTSCVGVCPHSTGCACRGPCPDKA